MKIADRVLEVSHEIGVRNVSSMIDGWVDDDHVYTYYEFYDEDGIYHGTEAYKWDDIHKCHEFHTAFRLPCRKSLALWQKSIGGTWVAYVRVGNEVAINPLLRGGYENYGVHTDDKKQVFYILLITYTQV